MSNLRTEYVPGNPKIAIDRAGNGPVVIFLHGIGGNRTNWRRQIEAFSNEFCAVAWDARGYGQSDDYGRDLDFADFTADLNRVCAHLEADRVHLVGLSMGGFIAMGFYEAHPDKVDRLVLCNTLSSFTGSYSEEEQKQFLETRLEPLISGRELRDISEPVAQALVSPSTPPEITQELVDSIAQLHKDSYIKTLKAAVYHDKTDLIPRIKTPTLLVYGEDDRLTPPEFGKEMQRKITDSQLVVIPRAGHLVNMEQSNKFNEAVLTFLKF